MPLVVLVCLHESKTFTQHIVQSCCTRCAWVKDLLLTLLRVGKVFYLYNATHIGIRIYRDAGKQVRRCVRVCEGHISVLERRRENFSAPSVYDFALQLYTYARTRDTRQGRIPREMFFFLFTATTCAVVFLPFYLLVFTRSTV